MKLFYGNLATWIICATIYLLAACNSSKSDKADNIEKSQNTDTSKIDSLPSPRGYVNDFEYLFVPAERKILDSLIADFENRTTIQIAVVTIDTLMTPVYSFDDYTLRLAEHWGVGRKETNNGVLIGISRGYSRMRIQNGRGIEKILSDGETMQIIENYFFPSYRKGEYFEGTFTGLKELMKTLEEKSK